MLNKIYEVYDLVCSNQNGSCDKLTEKYNTLLDDYEEYNEINTEYLEDFKTECLNAAGYAGYTNIQYKLLEKVNSLLGEL